MKLLRSYTMDKAIIVLLLISVLIGVGDYGRVFAEDTEVTSIIYLPAIHAGAPTVSSAQSGEPVTNQNRGSATISWAFFFEVENGEPHAVYRMVADIYSGGGLNQFPLTRVDRIEETYPAECVKNGSVTIEDNAAAFQGGYLLCKLEKASFQRFIEEVLAAGAPWGVAHEKIGFVAYQDPWAAADVDLVDQPLSGHYGTLVDHPDVCLRLAVDNEIPGHYPLELRVVAENQGAQDQYQNCDDRANLLDDGSNQLNWGVTSGQNRFWVGQNLENFLGLWSPTTGESWQADLQPWLAFLPRPDYFYELMHAGRFFWHRDTMDIETHQDATPTTHKFGLPTDIEGLEVTIGCDVNGENCVNMTLRTLLLDPTCMGG